MEVKDIREKIDRVDEKLLPLFLERMELSSQIAKSKATEGTPVRDPLREREILSGIREKSGDMERYAHQLYSGIFELSRAYQSSLIGGDTPVGKLIDNASANAEQIFPQTGAIACQGTEGAYSQLAADRIFPRGSIVYLRSFEGVFDAVESGLCRFGIVPLENSSNGSVRQVLELLCKRNVSVVRSARLCIRHELLAKPGTKLGDIKKIYSHEQALGQCSSFLSSFGDKVEIIPCDNTALAAKAVAASDECCAAISSHNCAALYGLETVNADIQDSDNNYTRFLCISGKQEIYAGANRIALILSLDHRPGSLYEMLSKLSALGVNLLKLESYPKTGHDFEFMFYLEMEASVADNDIRGMLCDMEREAESFHFLGNYSEM